MHYLDDFILLSCDRDLLEGVTETVAVRIRQAGFLVSSKSTLSPVQVLQALGKVVNLRERFIQVQPFVFLQLMVAWIRLATCARMHACMVIPKSVWISCWEPCSGIFGLARVFLGFLLGRMPGLGSDLCAPGPPP